MMQECIPELMINLSYTGTCFMLWTSQHEEPCNGIYFKPAILSTVAQFIGLERESCIHAYSWEGEEDWSYKSTAI